MNLELKDSGSTVGKSHKRISISLTSMNQMENESERVYKFRLENEAEELEKLMGVIESIIIIQKEFLANLQDSFDENLGCFMIGNSLQKLNESLLTPYTTYAVIALSGIQKTHFTLAEKGDLERVEFISKVVTKYVAVGNGEGIVDPEQREWEWYLQRPIQKIKDLTLGLKQIYEYDGLGAIIDGENKKIQVAGIKMECTYRAIIEHLKRAGKDIIE